MCDGLHVVESGEWYAHAFCPVGVLFQDFQWLAAIPSVSDAPLVFDVGHAPYFLARAAAEEGLVGFQVVVACPYRAAARRVFYDNPVVDVSACDGVGADNDFFYLDAFEAVVP